MDCLNVVVFRQRELETDSRVDSPESSTNAFVESPIVYHLNSGSLVPDHDLEPVGVLNRVFFG